MQESIEKQVLQIEHLDKELRDCIAILSDLKTKMREFYKIDAVKLNVELPCGNILHLNPTVGWKLQRGDRVEIEIMNRQTGIRQIIYSTQGYED